RLPPNHAGARLVAPADDAAGPADAPRVEATNNAAALLVVAIELRPYTPAGGRGHSGRRGFRIERIGRRHRARLCRRIAEALVRQAGALVGNFCRIAERPSWRGL